MIEDDHGIRPFDHVVRSEGATQLRPDSENIEETVVDHRAQDALGFGAVG